MVLFVEEVEFRVMESAVECVEDKLLHVEEKEKLPDYCQHIRTGLESHQNVILYEGVDVENSNSHKDIDDGDPDTLFTELSPLLFILLPGPC